MTTPHDQAEAREAATDLMAELIAVDATFPRATEGVFAECYYSRITQALLSFAAQREARVREECARIVQKRMEDCAHDKKPDAISRNAKTKKVNGCSRCWEDDEIIQAIRSAGANAGPK